jgi:hypothetical protein
MSDEKTRRRVFCVRNHVSKSSEEHLQCPYCFGKKREVIDEGERREFCDFNPDDDPVTFGFPEGSTRNAGS